MENAYRKTGVSFRQGEDYVSVDIEVQAFFIELVISTQTLAELTDSSTSLMTMQLSTWRPKADSTNEDENINDTEASFYLTKEGIDIGNWDTVTGKLTMRSNE